PPTRIPCGPVTPRVRPVGANGSTPPSGTAGIGFSFFSGAPELSMTADPQKTAGVADFFFLFLAAMPVAGGAATAATRSARAVPTISTLGKLPHRRRVIGGSMDARQDLDLRGRRARTGGDRVGGAGVPGLARAGRRARRRGADPRDRPGALGRRADSLRGGARRRLRRRAAADRHLRGRDRAAGAPAHADDRLRGRLAGGPGRLPPLPADRMRRRPRGRPRPPPPPAPAGDRPP